jgi:hypothetical protein
MPGSPDPYATWPNRPPEVRAGVGLRVAILILGAGVCAYIAMQINQMTRYSAFLSNAKDVIGEAGIVVVLWLIALAAVWGAPIIAGALFAVAAAMAFHLGATTFYGDMNVWGGIAVILVALCVVDWARRDGLARYPSLRRVQSRATTTTRRAVAAIVGIVIAAVLAKLVGL